MECFNNEFDLISGGIVKINCKKLLGLHIGKKIRKICCVTLSEINVFRISETKYETELLKKMLLERRCDYWQNYWKNSENTYSLLHC